jgi:predicted RNA-binding protein YlxR (DUF448 family)
LVFDGEMIVFDTAQRLPGRGAYLCPGQDCLTRGTRKGALARRLKVPSGAAAGLERRIPVEQEPPVWEN